MAGKAPTGDVVSFPATAPTAVYVHVNGSSSGDETSGQGAIVFDRQSVWIGSFNLDPRSTGINTEVGVMIDSPEIATQVADFMEEGITPGSAYHVTLDEKGDLLWTTEIDGKEVRYDHDPAIGLWRSLKIQTLRLLPIQNEL